MQDVNVQLSISRRELEVREDAWMIDPFPVESVTPLTMTLIRAFTVPLSVTKGEGRVADPIRMVDSWKLPNVTWKREEEGLEVNVKWISSNRTPAEMLPKLTTNDGVSEVMGLVTRVYVVELML